MTPAQKLKLMILAKRAAWTNEPLPDLTAENIDTVYCEAVENDDGDLQDAQSEVRCAGIETGLDCPPSRHYEADAVAAQALDGSWVGWTYWHGGGKHGEPEAIDWISDAYALDCAEEQKTVTVRTFKKAA